MKKNLSTAHILGASACFQVFHNITNQNLSTWQMSRENNNIESNCKRGLISSNNWRRVIVSKIFILTLLFTGPCLAAPSWFLNSTPSDPQFIYGSGSAPSKQDAINAALNDALSQVRTTVGGVIKSESVSTNNRISDEISVRITNEVEKFSLSGYKVSKTEYVKKDKLYFAQVQIDKMKIYEEKLVEYEAETDAISRFKQSLESAPTMFEKLQLAKKILLKAENSKRNIYILYSLDSSFPFRESLKKNHEYGDIRNQILKATGFRVKGTGATAQALKEVISQLSLKTFGLHEITITFKTTGSESRGQVYGSFYFKSQISIEMMEEGKTVNSINFSITGTSAISEETAYLNALKDLKKQFAEKLTSIIEVK